MNIAKNLEKVNAQIVASGRKREDITVVAVTKSLDNDKTEKVLQAGLHHLGENRPDAFLQKYEQFGNRATWHFIGTLQTRKVKDVIHKIDYLHSLDRLSLAKEINKRSREKIKCFVQIKTSDEETKQGLSPKDAVDFVKAIEQYDKIEVVGLMTMAPFTEDEQVIRHCFSVLKQCQAEIQALNLESAPCLELSIGMSNDYPVALEEGATFIRLGTCLVGE